MSNKQSIEPVVNDNLDASIENLHPDVRRRLNQARIKAVESRGKPQMNWRLTGALSFALVLALSWNFIPEPSLEVEPLLTEVLEEDLDMLEDLDFIVWMSEDQEDVSL